MKNAVSVAILLLAFTTSTLAQKGFEVQKEITINVPASELWDMVGPGFEDVHVWASSVNHSEGSGSPEFSGATCSERTCKVNLGGFDQISEKLYKYDEATMNLAYEVNSGMPKFVTRAANDWKVVAIDENTSKLVMNAEFETKGFMGGLMRGMMKSKMNRTLEDILNDAKIYAETGRVSKLKAKKVKKFQKKTA